MAMYSLLKIQSGIIPEGRGNLKTKGTIFTVLLVLLLVLGGLSSVEGKEYSFSFGYPTNPVDSAANGVIGYGMFCCDDEAKTQNCIRETFVPLDAGYDGTTYEDPDGQGDMYSYSYKTTIVRNNPMKYCNLHALTKGDKSGPSENTIPIKTPGMIEVLTVRD